MLSGCWKGRAMLQQIKKGVLFSGSSFDSTEMAPISDAISAVTPTEGNCNEAAALVWDPGSPVLMRVVEKMDYESLEKLVAAGTAVNAHCGSFNETVLHIAVKENWTDGVSLLLRAGAQIYSKNTYGQTPMHYAAASESATCMKLLLKSSNKILEPRDMRGYTPLHDAAAVGSTECIAQLLKKNATVDAADNKGETPLHKAVTSKSTASILALLNAGANLGAHDMTGETVLSFLLRHLPGVIHTIFDDCLTTNSKKLTVKNLEVHLNFVPLCGNDERNQSKNLKSLVKLGHCKLLLHPLCETFLYLKWNRVKKIFHFEILFYFVFAILTTLLVLDKYVWGSCESYENCTLYSYLSNDSAEFNHIHLYNVTRSKYIDSIPQLSLALLVIVCVQSVMIFLQQLLVIWQEGFSSVRSLWHVMHFAIITMVFMVLFRQGHEWQHHIAAFLLLILWAQCMLFIGRFPASGIYIAMFTRVAKVFVRIFAVYFCLLLAFALSFYVAHHSNKVPLQRSPEGEEEGVFGNPFLVFMKTLTMMIGELDFGDEYVQKMNELPVTSHLIFTAFSIWVAIILSNLLVALAVNDVQGLRNSAHLERLIKQMELVYRMEKNLNTVSYVWSFLRLDKCCRVRNLFMHDCKNIKVFIAPYHHQKNTHLFLSSFSVLHEIKATKGIIANIMDTVRMRETEANCDRKYSVKFSRRSRHSKSEFNNNEEIKENFKEIESVLDDMQEKIISMATVCTSLDSRLASLEKNTALLLDLIRENGKSSLQKPQVELHQDKEV